MAPEYLYSYGLEQTVSFQSLICLELQCVQNTAVQLSVSCRDSLVIVSLPTEDLHKGLGLDNGSQGQSSVTDIDNIRLGPAMDSLPAWGLKGKKTLHGGYFYS